jgi:hypothetical protein
MTVGEALLAGIIIGFVSTIIILGVFANGISAVIDAYEDIIERIDEHRRWVAKREIIDVSSDLKDIEDWMNQKEVKEVIASREFGVWLRHRVTAEIERKLEERKNG